MPVAGTPVTLMAYWEESENSIFGRFPLSDLDVTVTPSGPDYALYKDNDSTYRVVFQTTGLAPGTYNVHFTGYSIVESDEPFTDSQYFVVTAAPVDPEDPLDPEDPPATGSGLIPLYTAGDPLFWRNNLGAKTNIKTISLSLAVNGASLPTSSTHVRLDDANFTLTVDATDLPSGTYVARSTATTYDGRTLTDDKTFIVAGGPAAGYQWVYPPEKPLEWHNVFGQFTRISSIQGQVSQEGYLFGNNITYERIKDPDGPGGFSETHFAVAVQVAGLAPGVYSLGSIANSTDGRELTALATFIVGELGGGPDIPTDGKYPLLTVTDLANFSGRPRLSYSAAYAGVALKQSALLLRLATCRKVWPEDEDQAELLRNAILSVADGIVLSQPHQKAAASPFQSESLGAYSYSRLQKQVRLGLPTGDDWFDLAVEELSLCDVDEISSGSVDVFETALHSSQRRRFILGV